MSQTTQAEIEVGDKVVVTASGRRGQVLRIIGGALYVVWFAFGDRGQFTAGELERVAA